MMGDNRLFKNGCIDHGKFLFRITHWLGVAKGEHDPRKE